MVDASLQRFLVLASQRLIDARTGIVRVVSEQRPEAGSAGLFLFTARARGLDGSVIDTGGVASSRPLALAKAIGEALERYCAGLESAHAVRLASYAAADFPAIHPRSFALYTQPQLAERGFPFAPLDTESVVGWVEARDAASGERWFVPANKVFMPYRPRTAAGERALFQTISTGLACHQSYERAALAAICEVIERDAFTIAWQAGLSPPRVRLTSLDAQLGALAARYTRDGSELHLLNATLDSGVPTLLAVLQSQVPGAPAAVFSAATDLNPRIALRKCLEELQQMRSFAGWVMARRPQPPPGPDEVRCREDHVRFYCEQENARQAAFLLGSSVTQDFSALANLAGADPHRDLELLVERVASLGERVLLVDLTSQELRPLGLRVVRAVVTGFQPLVFGHRLRALACARRWTVPRALGYAAPGAGQPDNAAPNPFP